MEGLEQCARRWDKQRRQMKNGHRSKNWIGFTIAVPLLGTIVDIIAKQAFLCHDEKCMNKQGQDL